MIGTGRSNPKILAPAGVGVFKSALIRYFAQKFPNNLFTGLFECRFRGE
jgi:hypothetical protein